jgi:hypothetical protein
LSRAEMGECIGCEQGTASNTNRAERERKRVSESEKGRRRGKG